MTKIDTYKVLEEIAVFIKNQNVFTITVRGVTTVTDEFNGTGSLKTFTMTTSPTNVRNVRSVTIGGVAQTLLTEYTFDYLTGIITFTTAPGTGTNNVDVQYDYGTSDKIYTDFPRADLQLKSYPRISVGMITSESSERGLNADIILTNLTVEIKAFGKGINEVDGLLKTIRDAIIDNKKKFNYFKFISPIGMGPLNPEAGRAQEVVSRNLDLRILLQPES